MNSQDPRPSLRVVDIISLTVGTVIGVGIFRAPGSVANGIDSETAVLLLWLAGGLVSIVGALVYAELASAFPSAGGEYHFIGKAFGRQMAFMYAWGRATVILPGSIAVLALTFGDYMTHLLPLGEHSTTLWALFAALACTGINFAGIRRALLAQGLLLLADALCLGALIAAPFFINAAPAASAATTNAATLSPNWGLAMVFVLFTYGGWNEAAYVSAEARDRQRGVLWGLVIGLTVITALYLAVNYAYLKGLGLAGLAQSATPAASLLEAAFGPMSRTLVSAFIALSALKSVNATVFFGARTYFALGRDLSGLRWLGDWEGQGGPRRALLVQAVITLSLIGLSALAHDGFTAAVEFTAPAFWFFILLVSLAIFRLRGHPDRKPGFLVPGYPVLPLVFTAASAWLLYSSVSYHGMSSLVGVGYLLCGLVPMSLLLRPRRAEAGA